MPVYEFECPKCSTQFELTRPMSKAGSAASCPKCKAKARRKFSATIITTGVASSDFDIDDMPDFGGGGDHGHGMPDMGGMGGMPDMGGMDDFDF